KAKANILHELDDPRPGCETIDMRAALVAFFVSAAVAGCGASSAQIAKAKSAVYVASPTTILDVATQITQQSGYVVDDVDPTKFRIRTKAQFYSSEGDRESPGAGGFVNAKGGSVSLTLLVEIMN